MNIVVYILYSEKLDKFYIGFSENFEQRLIIHNSVENDKWSKAGRPWKEFFRISCCCKIQALRIEKYIKTQKSKKYIIKLKETPTYVDSLLIRFAHDC